jgi:hypothetical protein
MPSRKQRRREAKERRHQYETVWVDAEGNELDEPPDDVAPPKRERQKDPMKPERKRPQQRAAGATRTPLPPSWRRAAKRALILGAAIFAFMALTARTKTGQHEYGSAVFLAVVSAGIFTPYMYVIDRFLYKRWERKQGAKPKKR